MHNSTVPNLDKRIHQNKRSKGWEIAPFNYAFLIFYKLEGDSSPTPQKRNPTLLNMIFLNMDDKHSWRLVDVLDIFVHHEFIWYTNKEQPMFTFPIHDFRVWHNVTNVNRDTILKQALDFFYRTHCKYVI